MGDDHWEQMLQRDATKKKEFKTKTVNPQAYKNTVNDAKAETLIADQIYSSDGKSIGVSIYDVNISNEIDEAKIDEA